MLIRFPDNISKYEHIERIFDDNNKLINNKLEHLEQIMDQRFELRDRASSLANKNMEMRLDKLNELRNEVIEDRSRYVVKRYNNHGKKTKGNVRRNQFKKSIGRMENDI